MRVIGLAGWSGAGKTALVTRLIPELRRRGVTVSTVKHAHHAVEVDVPGKDSFAHRQAGASEVIVASPARWALVHDLRDGEREPSLATLLSRLGPVDLVLVEGFRSLRHARIEVHRVANGKPFLFPSDPAIVAVATDAPAVPGGPRRVSIDDTPAVADLVLETATALSDTLAALADGPRGEG
jgi:molybdopterin-guanine dinucleotide biosynthesis adapter protein